MRREAGFTLLELSVALLLLGLLAGLAAPDLAALLTRSDLDRATAEVGDLLRTARSEAVRSGTPRHLRVAAGGERVLGPDDRFELPDGVRLRPVGTPGLTFYPTGLSTGGRWRLRARDGTGVALVVSPLASTVRVERPGPRERPPR